MYFEIIAKIEGLFSMALCNLKKAAIQRPLENYFYSILKEKDGSNI